MAIAYTSYTILLVAAPKLYLIRTAVEEQFVRLSVRKGMHRCRPVHSVPPFLAKSFKKNEKLYFLQFEVNFGVHRYPNNSMKCTTFSFCHSSVTCSMNKLGTLIFADSLPINFKMVLLNKGPVLA